MSRPGKVPSRCVELNHILHRLCGPPSIPLSFNLAVVLPRRGTYCVNSGTEGVDTSYTLVPIVYGQGLPGYLIPFAPLAFAPQRQFSSRKSPSPLVFFLISTHFTATLGNSTFLSDTLHQQFPSHHGVKPRTFKTD